ncbi:hypothetical protein [Achromobacter pestifer]
MSFHTTIARLREASYAAPAAGENPDTCRVGRQDLRTTLHLIDRLDADLQRAALASAPVADMGIPMSLPPLPPRFSVWKDPDEDCGAWGQPDRDVFTADQMREYARAARASARVAGEVQNPVACVRVTHKGYAMELSTYVTYALPEGMHDLYAAPRASEAVRTEALYLLREARALLPMFATAEAIGNWSEKVNQFAAGRMIDVPPQADKGGQDSANGAGGNLVQEFIDATDALLASQARKTWTSGYKNALSAGERIRIAERWRQLRADLSSPTPPDKNGGGDA